MNPIQNFFINDPKAKQKIIFVLVAITLILGIIWLVVFINTAPNRATNRVNNQDQTNSSNSISPTFNFEDKNKLTPENIGIPSQIEFVDRSEEVFYVNQDFFLRSNRRSITSENVINPYDLKYTPKGVIINQDSGDLFFNFTTEQIESFPLNVFSVTPFGEFYYMIDPSGKDISIKFTTNLPVRSNFTALSVASNLPNYEAYDLRVIANKLYLFFYEEFTRQGDVEIWYLNTETNQPLLAGTLNDVQSIRFFNDQVFYTYELTNPKILTNYGNNLLDFETSITGKIINLDIDEAILDDEIYGTVLAQKCLSLNKLNLIKCAVKKNKVAYNDEQTIDIVFTYDYVNKIITYPDSNTVTAISTLHQKPDGKDYFIPQIDKALYELD